MSSKNTLPIIILNATIRASGIQSLFLTFEYAKSERSERMSAWAGCSTSITETRRNRL